MTTTSFPSDLEIARAAQLEPIADVAARAGLTEDCLEPYGRYVAKVDAGSPSRSWPTGPARSTSSSPR